MVFCFFFFFQAEDGIRDHCVTGVQTCALPICCAVQIGTCEPRIKPHSTSRLQRASPSAVQASPRVASREITWPPSELPHAASATSKIRESFMAVLIGRGLRDLSDLARPAAELAVLTAGRSLGVARRAATLPAASGAEERRARGR